MSAFLLEIGVEEVPAGMIAAAAAELASRLASLLTRERLATGSPAVTGYSTPRRLAVLVEGLLPRQADLEEEVVGPSVKIAYKAGAPSPAAIAFAKKNGVEVSALRTIQNAKGEYVAATVRRVGRSAAAVLTDALPAEIAHIYWPKNMVWRAGKPERFVRPVRWLLALLDDEIVPVEFAGVTAGRVTRGHRVLHGEAPVVVSTPLEYAEMLRTAYVEVDPTVRRQRIRKSLDAAARKIPGARWREDEGLVETVTHLTEWPSVLPGSFDASYLDLPEEVLVTVMRDHQKYFAIENKEMKLLPNFLTVLNIEVDAAGEAIIRHGNERVLRARFNDARFFWNVDQKIPLAGRVELLKQVTFQKDFGSYWDKTQAVLGVATALVGIAEQKSKLDASSARPYLDHAALLKAAELLKTDLTTELVKEFTELQGVVGGLYARAQGLGDAVANAIYSQYMPASVSDAIPPTGEGLVLGLADRIQTIAAMFQLGLEPTGSKDPFALRRAGNAIAKIMTTSVVSSVLTLSELVRAAVDLTAPDNEELATHLAARITSFLEERIAYYLTEAESLPADCVKAAMASGCDDVRDVFERAKALNQMRDSADFLAVCAAFKRIRKILEQARESGETIGANPSEAVFAEPAEKDLYARATAVSITGRSDYVEVLKEIATLRPVVDTFFDQVMVMAPEEDRRHNRLALLQLLYNDFTRVADFSQIAVEGAPA